jgi:hypothetical protein
MSDTSAPATVAAPAAKEKQEAQETLGELVTALKPLLPDIKEMIISSGRQATTQVILCALGGAGVLGLAYVAAVRDKWDVAEKLAIPVLSFFAGILAGKGKS